MDRLHKLETFANELAVAVKSLGAHYRNGESEESREVQRARRAIMGNAARIQTLLGEPSDFLQRLASQVCSNSLITKKRMLMLHRTKFWHASSGWESFRCLHAYHSVAPSLQETLLS